MNSIVYPKLLQSRYPTIQDIGIDPENGITAVAKARLEELARWRQNNLEHPDCWSDVKRIGQYFCCPALPLLILADICQERPVPENEIEAKILMLKKPEDCLCLLEEIKNLDAYDDSY